MEKIWKYQRICHLSGNCPKFKKILGNCQERLVMKNNILGYTWPVLSTLLRIINLL